MTTETAPATSTFCYNELATSDVEAAKSFYTQLFGWQSKESDIGSQGAYTIFTANGKDCAGMMKKPEEHVPTSWLSYVTVDDVDANALTNIALANSTDDNRVIDVTNLSFLRVKTENTVSDSLSTVAIDASANTKLI